MTDVGEFITDNDDLEHAIQFENSIIRSKPLNEDRMDFRTFVYFADRWAALGARQRAAALAIARGSMDTATDLIGPRHLSAEDAKKEVQTPAWAEVTSLVEDIEWVCLDADSVGDD